MPTLSLQPTITLKPFGIDVTELKINDFALIINPYKPPTPPIPVDQWLLQPRPIPSGVDKTVWDDIQFWMDNKYWTEI